MELAVAGIVDASKPGVMDRYFALGGFHENDLTKAAQKRLEAISSQLKFQTNCATIPLTAGPHESLRRFAIDGLDLDARAFWLKDSHKLAVLVADKVYTP